MQMVQAICNVQIQRDCVLAKLDMKGPNVMQLVIVISPEQVAHHVINLQVNALATQVTQEPHVTPVIQITTEQVMELVQVCIIQ